MNLKKYKRQALLHILQKISIAFSLIMTPFLIVFFFGWKGLGIVIAILCILALGYIAITSFEEWYLGIVVDKMRDDAKKVMKELPLDELYYAYKEFLESTKYCGTITPHILEQYSIELKKLEVRRYSKPIGEQHGN